MGVMMCLSRDCPSDAMMKRGRKSFRVILPNRQAGYAQNNRKKLLTSNMIMKTLFALSLTFFSFIALFPQEVTSLTLVNANTDADIRILRLQDTIFLHETGNSLNIRANVSGTVGSVRFGYDGNTNRQTENSPPYAFAGDNAGDYNAWSPSTGEHTITATPWSGSNATGTAGPEYAIHLMVDAEEQPGSDTLVLPENCGTGAHILHGELKKWHKVTLSFDGPPYRETDLHPNPFLDYRLNVVFSNGTRSVVVPGYFSADGNAAETSADSGNVWRVHFTPDAEGTWNWNVSFRFGREVAVSVNKTAGKAVPPLDGQSGSFVIGPTDKSGRDLRAKGRLDYVGAHYLRFEETGEYFLKGGPDAPENLLAYEDFDNTPNNGGRRKSWSPHAGDWNQGDPSWKEGKGTELIGAINYLAGEGLNAFSLLTMNINGDDKNVYPYISDNDFKHFDCSKLDQWSIVFDHAMHKGMFLHFKTQETENELLLDGGATGTNRKLYYRELVARFGYQLALNWNLGEENSDQTDAQRRDMARYFYDIDPYHHHIVIHTYPNAYDHIYTPLLGNASKLTGASMQIFWNSVHNVTKTWVNRSAVTGKNWVIANDEQGSAKIGVPDDSYSGSPSIHDIRKQTLWGNLMGGGAGVEYYFGYDLPNSDLTAQDFRSRDLSWDYVRYALEFFRENKVPFWQMRPADNLVSNGWCFADEGNVYVIFLPDGGTTTLNLDGDQNYSVAWYDPENGGALQEGSTEAISGTGWQPLGTAPYDADHDWVILVSRYEGIHYAPQARASSDVLTGEVPLEVLFDASSSSDKDGTIDLWTWGFGDGTSDTGQIVSHTFDDAGDFLVKLTIEDNDGKTATDILNMKVLSNGLQIDCDSIPFRETGKLLVAEIESVPAATGWIKENSVTGFTGNSYYRWNGGDAFNTPGSGLLEYKIYITNPGTYRFVWHSKIMNGTDPTESNDSWLRIPDADDFFAQTGTSVKYPAGGKFVQSETVVEGTSTGGWMKVYSSGTTDWTWSTNTSDSDAHQIYATFAKPGAYTVQISGRSNGHALDRFVLYNEQEYSFVEATAATLDEMFCGSRPPVYHVKFIVSDGKDPVSGAEVIFLGNSVLTDNTGEALFTGVEVAFNEGFSVSNECFDTYTGSMDITGDVNYSVDLSRKDEPPCNGEPVTFTVVFNISDGMRAISGAQVTFNEVILASDASGRVVFNSVDPRMGMIFSVSRNGFEEFVDTVDITNDIMIPVILSRASGRENDYFGSVSIYPNPVQQWLYISGLKGENTLRLFSCDGRLRNVAETKETSYTMPAGDLPAGLYIIRITAANGLEMHRQIVVE